MRDSTRGRKLMFNTALPMLAVLGACASETSVVEVGIVELDTRFKFDVPDAARVGEPFEVGVTTYGDSCVSEEATQVAMTKDDSATITPYDRRIIPNDDTGYCQLVLLLFPHRAHVVFTTPGTKTLRLQGRKMTHRGEISNVEYERTIEIEAN
jgi:hypothetical protein